MPPAIDHALGILAFLISIAVPGAIAIMVVVSIGQAASRRSPKPMTCQPPPQSLRNRVFDEKWERDQAIRSLAEVEAEHRRKIDKLF